MESRGRCLEDRRHTNREVDRSELNSNKSHNHKSDQRTIQEHCAMYKRVELQVDVGEGRLLGKVGSGLSSRLWSRYLIDAMILRASV